MAGEINWIIGFVFLIICAAADIKKKEIPIIVIIVFGCLSLLYIGICEKQKWSDIVYSLIPGGLLLALGLCTRQSIGYGDGLVALILGMLIGLEGCIAAIIIGFISSMLYAMPLLVCRRVNGKSRMPFMPFLTIGLGVFCFVQKGL